MLPRLARFCVRHRRTVVLAWLLAFIGGLALGLQVFPRLGIDYEGSSVESYRGQELLNDSSQFGPRVLALLEVGQPLTSASPAAGTLRDVLGEVDTQDGVGRVVDPLTAPAQLGLLSDDGTAALVVVDLDKDLAEERDHQVIDAVTENLRELERDESIEVTVGGNRLLRQELAEQSEADTEKGEFIALPLTLLVMVFLFGGLVAAGIPFLGALVSIAGGLATLYGLSYVLELDAAVPSVTTVMGLGLSIDYALLIVSRYREERGLGRSTEDAIVVAMTTAGRTITFSAVTVAVSLAGLFVFDEPVFRALAAAGISVVLIALAAGLTLVPALLALFARRIKAPTTRVSDEGFFSRLARATQQRATLVAVSLSAVLLASGAPFLAADFRNGGADLLPEHFESRQFADKTARLFPATETEPVIVVARVAPERLDAYAGSVADLPEVRRVSPAEARQDGWASVEITPYGESQGDGAKNLVSALRDSRPDFRTWVTGDAAILLDFQGVVKAGLPWAALILGVGTFILLFLMTGSVLVPLKALVMNTLSLGATFGLLVLVFQEGYGADLLGFTPTGGIETWVPVIVFAFAFGLSMDYEVFLLSRIKELYDSGMPNDRAVQVGLQRSGRIITSAALLVIIVFLGFAAGELLSIKQMGLALATAVAVDATLVRCLLVPATMTLLGERNWWAPPFLRRLHDRIGLREHVEPPPISAAPRTSSMASR